MSRVRPGVSDKSAARVRDVLRSARSHLRLRADSRRDLALDDREARRTICGAIANCCRSISASPRSGPFSGFTPLLHCKRLGAELGLKHLYIKDDTVNHPTLSYKDRVVSVSITKAREFGFTTVSCASTGNLATAVAAHAARAGLQCYIFMPEGVEAGKIVGSTIYGAQVITIRGNYDDVNRLCSEIADKYGWAFVNINLRPFYTEGAKTFGFESRGATRLAPAGSHGVADRGRHDSAESRQGI